MFDIAVCDDERYQLGNMEWLLGNLGKKMNLSMEIDTYESGEALLDSMRKGMRYDLIYLDIELSGMNGLETAERIREIDWHVPLVYVTYYESYMIDTFCVTPSGFIVKPVDAREFEKTFKRICMRLMDKDEYYRFQYDKKPYKIPLRDIKYFESNLRQIEIVWEGGRCRLYKKMQEIEEELGEYGRHFLRVHRSYLVNYSYVEKLTYYYVMLETGEKLPISRGKRVELEKKLLQLLE